MKRRINVIPAAALVVVALGAAGLLRVIPDGLSTLAVFTALVWVPGSLLVPRPVFEAVHPAGRPALALVAGLAAASVLIACISLFTASLSVVVGFMEVGAAAVLAKSSVATRVRSPGAPAPGKHSPTGVVVPVAFVLVAGIGAVSATAPGVSGDGYDHVGTILRMEQSGNLRAGEVLAPGKHGRPLPEDPRKGTLHGLLAAVCRVSGATPWRLWEFLPFIVFPCFVGAFLAYCALFVRNGWELFLCGVLFAMSYGGAGYRFAGSVLYGQNLSVLWLWILTTTIVGVFGAARHVGGICRVHRRSAFVFLAMAGAGGSLVHAGVAMHAGVLAVTLALFSPVFGMTRRDAAVIGILLVACVLPGVMTRAMGAHEVNWIHAHTQGVLWIDHSQFVVSPAENLREFGMMFLGGLVLAPLVAASSRRDSAAGRQAAVMAVPLVICFVPPITTWLYSAGSYMVFRVLLAVPAYPMITGQVARALVRARRRSLPRRVWVVAASALWALIFVSPTVRALGNIPQGDDPSARLEDVARVIRGLPRGGVVASDPCTSYALSARVANPMLGVYGQHGNPFDILASDRLDAAECILSPWVGVEHASTACDRFNVAIVVLNGRTPTRSDGWLTRWDNAEYSRAVNRLRSLPGCFRTLYERDDVTVMLYDPAGSVRSNWGPDAWPFERAVSASNCNVRAPDGAFRVTGLVEMPPRPNAGDTITVSIVYDRSVASRERLPDEIHIRFDHESIPTTCRFPGGKIWRRFRERSGALRKRFRIDHRPFRGRLPRSVWPIGPPVAESFPVVIPDGMQPGVYRMEVAVTAASCVPNFTLADFLCDHDHYSGQQCATVHIGMGGGGH